MLTGTVWSCGNWVLRCWMWFPGKETGGVTLVAGDEHRLGNSLMQNKCSTQFLFFTFSHKNKNPLDLFQLAKTGTYSYRSFRKAKWLKANIWKVVGTCTHWIHTKTNKQQQKNNFNGELHKLLRLEWWCWLPPSSFTRTNSEVRFPLFLFWLCHILAKVKRN